jgi:hypothetical protein
MKEIVETVGQSHEDGVDQPGLLWIADSAAEALYIGVVDLVRRSLVPAMITAGGRGAVRHITAGLILDQPLNRKSERIARSLLRG